MEVTQKCLILSGLPGSGKSRFAQEWTASEKGRARINWDELRLYMFGPDWRWNKADERKMQDKSNEMFRSFAELGMDIVIDNTNLTPKSRERWETLARAHGMEIEHVQFDTPLATCIERDRQRTGRARVGRAVIERMALFNGFIDFSDREVYPRDFIIVDMDGTVANCDDRRKRAFQGPTIHKRLQEGADGGDGGPCPLEKIVTDRYCNACGGSANKNWPLFFQGIENDPPITPIIELIARVLDNTGAEYGEDDGLDVIIVSGRSLDEGGTGTEKWIEKNLPFPVKHLFMRNAQDYRADDIVKQEILDLLPKERIKWVFDDRQRVVDMWRRNGLTCLQVADGQF